jgi:hypothetical protein
LNRRFRLTLAFALSLALVGGLVLSLVSGSGAPGARTANTSQGEEFLGIAQGSRLDTEDLQTMTATGVRVDRLLLSWDFAQPSEGSFRWPDLLVGSLAADGIEAVPFVWASPSWLTGVRERPPVGSRRAEHAWRHFLKAAVKRYGPGGSYWADVYHRQFGASATPVPIQSWEIWNEPNLDNYFAPKPSVSRYARLLRIAHDAIKSQDPHAQIVLAGITAYGHPQAWKFLDQLYRVPGAKGDFDVAALNPYASNLRQVRGVIERFHAVMRKHGDEKTPLWITELGWGSAPPDRFGLNRGIRGQAKMLAGSFKLILDHRRAWNVKRLFWFDWRDPGRTEQAGACSFCGSAGLLKHNRDPKPAYKAFKRFARAN